MTMKPLLFFVAVFVGLYVLAALVSEPQEKREWREAKMSPTEAFHQSVPEAQMLIAQGERDGLMLLEPDNKRAYVAPGIWRAADAKRKEFLVQILALECAKRRGDESLKLEVIDKQSGRTLADSSTFSGVTIH